MMDESLFQVKKYIHIDINMPCELCRVIFACKYIFIQACYLVVRIST
jgi:hypothetical protein